MNPIVYVRIIAYTVLVCALVGGEVWFYNWSYDRGFTKEKVVYDDFVQTTAAAGVKAKSDADAADAKNAHDATIAAQSYQAALSASDAYWLGKLRSAQGSAGGGGVSKTPSGPGKLDEPATNPLSTPAIVNSPEVITLEGQCAETTLELESLQQRLTAAGVVVDNSQ
jgi:hypothetical protein